MWVFWIKKTKRINKTEVMDIMKWRRKIAAVISIFGTIIVVESVGLGQYLASALTMDTPQKRYIWGIVGVGVLVFLMIVNYILFVKNAKKKRRYAS